MITRKKVALKDIKNNEANPRYIKDDDFKALVKSLKELPEMADVREIVVNEDMTILGGNMRYRAMLEAGWKECNVAIVDWSEEKQREFIIKDNVSRGEWNFDQLANEWDIDLLKDWGVELPKLDTIDFENIESNEDRTANSKAHTVTCPDCGNQFEA